MNDTELSGGGVDRTMFMFGAELLVTVKDMTVSDGLHQQTGAGIHADIKKLVLDHVKVTDNQATNGIPLDTDGIGVYVTGKLVMRDSVVSENVQTNAAEGFGSGIYIAGTADSIISNSRIVNNEGARGGGIFAGADLVIRHSRISGNEIVEEDGDGAGLLVYNSTVKIIDSLVQANEASATGVDGGGIWLEPGTSARANLIRTVVSRNSAENGGGIWVQNGNIAVKKSIIRNNHADPEFGGGIFNEGHATVKNSTLANNTAGEGGGAIENHGSGTSLELVNSTLSGNKADEYGGGIDSYDGSSATLKNVTFTKNVGDDDEDGGVGGGFHSDGSDFKIKNVVSVNNLTRGGGPPDCDGDVTSQGGNVIGDEEGCEGKLDGPGDVIRNARLGPLAFNGGSTPTHMLKAGSPAIGRGRPVCPGNDQRGAPRKDCDSGGYERVKCRGTLVDVIGTPRRDTLRGTNGPNGILGFNGGDRLVGRGAGDGLCGGGGNDRLAGGGGDDELDGAGGNDICVGGAGNDHAIACETERTI